MPLPPELQKGAPLCDVFTHLSHVLTVASHTPQSDPPPPPVHLCLTVECIASSLHFLQHCLSVFQSISFHLSRSHPPGAGGQWVGKGGGNRVRQCPPWRTGTSYTVSSTGRGAEGWGSPRTLGDLIRGWTAGQRYRGGQLAPHSSLVQGAQGPHMQVVHRVAGGVQHCCSQHVVGRHL